MLNLDKIQEKIKQRHEEHDRIWNAAIEAAAGKCGMSSDWLAHEIRKLKK